MFFPEANGRSIRSLRHLRQTKMSHAERTSRTRRRTGPQLAFDVGDAALFHFFYDGAFQTVLQDLPAHHFQSQYGRARAGRFPGPSSKDHVADHPTPIGGYLPG
jgi:hypothetical protein